MTSSQDLDQVFADGQRLLDDESYQEAIALLQEAVREHPGDARSLFHLGGAYDAAGEEALAVAPYRQALEIGLGEDEHFRACIQLASTLRNLGENAESVQILDDLCTERPDHRAARAFLALALTSAGDASRGVAELLDMMLTNPGPFEAYTRSLRWYADDLAGKAV